MADFDNLMDLEGDFATHLSKQLLTLASSTDNEYNVPGEIQAAQVFVNIIVPARTHAFMDDDDLYRLATTLTDTMEEAHARGTGWNYKGTIDLFELVPTLIDGLRGWAMIAEAHRNPGED
jgi:hypothetical protein